MPQYVAPWKYEAPQAAPPPPEQPGLLKRGWDLLGDAGKFLDRNMALQALDLYDPDYRKSIEIEEKYEGKQRTAPELYGTIRRMQEPGWEGPTGLDKALALGAFAGQYPLASTLGTVAPGVGHLAGWMLGRHAAHVADPEMAGASLGYDLLGAGAGKALGTGASMAYRSAIQPKLAATGLTSAAHHPVAARVLDFAEKAMDPAIGPQARNFLLPRWANRRLQRLGPQGAPPLRKAAPMKQVQSVLEELPPEPEDLTTLTDIGKQSQLPLPAVARQMAMPGMRPGMPRMPQRMMRPPGTAMAHQAPPPGGQQMIIPQRPVQGALPGMGPIAQKRAPFVPPTPVPAPRGAVKTGIPAEQLSVWKVLPQKMSVGQAAEDVVSMVPRGGKLNWNQYANGLKKATGLPRAEWVGVLRVHKALASSLGETPDDMIGRMFRGVMKGEEHAEIFPGISKFRPGSPEYGKALGIAHFTDDGRAILAFSDKLRSGAMGSAKQLEAAMHEPLHVFMKWMPARDKAIFNKALGLKAGEAWADVNEHQAILWAMEYLRGGQAPTKGLATTFERFKTWLRSLVTKGKKGGPPAEVKEALDRMLTPGGYEKQAKKAVKVTKKKVTKKAPAKTKTKKASKEAIETALKTAKKAKKKGKKRAPKSR